MTKWWEDVLGQRMLFLEDPEGKWRWESHDIDVRQDATTSFRSLQAARLAAAAAVYHFFVLEEVTSDPAQPFTRPSSGQADGPTPSPTSPPHGSGGENN